MALREAAKIYLEADSRGIRKGTKDLRALERQAGKAEQAATRMGKRIGALAGTIAAGLFTRGVIQNTIRQEKAIALLNNSLRATGRYTDEASQALQDHANALQLTTTFGNEAINEMQSLLLTFKEIGSNTFPQATEAILDMSVVMNQDLKSSVVQVGKALNDPITGVTALTRVGVTFTDKQKEMIRTLAETGDVAGAQAIILQELETEFGGAAEAARNTFGGALEGVKNALGDLLEVDGDSLPALIDQLNELEETLRSPGIQKGFQNLSRGVLNLVGLGAEALGELGSLGDQVGAGWAKAFGNLTLADELQQELNAVERALSGSFFSRPLKFLTASREELEALRDDLREQILQVNYDDQGFERPEPEDQKINVIPGLDKDTTLDPVELTIDPKIAAKWAKRQAEFEIELREMGERASASLTETLSSLTIELGDEETSAAFAYAEQLKEIDTIQNQLNVSGQLTEEQLARLNEARKLSAQVYQEEIDAIEAARAAKEAELTVAQELIQDLEFEQSLIGLTNEQKQIEIALRYANVDAMSAEGMQIRQLMTDIQEGQEATRAMDEFRRSASRALGDFISGSKSASEAFDAFMDHLRQRIAQMLAERLIEQLFGSFGTPGGGSAGGIGSFFAGLFGGGRHGGGTVYPNTLHPVAETGPELLTVGSQQYLLPDKKGGRVEPLQKNDNRQTSITVNLPPDVNRRTAQQTATDVYRIQKRAQSRNS